MGKNLRIALKVKGFTIYPYLLKLTPAITAKQGGYRGINIRIVKDQKMVFDVECYDAANIRIKATAFENGFITKGFSTDTINLLNLRIKEIQNQIAAYISTHNHLTKPLLMSSLYGTEFTSTHKKRRRQYITIPVTDYKGVITTAYELENKEVKQLLQPHLTKQTFKNSDGTKKTIEGIFDPETGENAIQSEDDFYDVVTVLNEEKIENERIQKEVEALAKMEPAERYLLGKFDKTNIFECFAAVWYPTKDRFGKETMITNSGYAAIVLRLYQYRHEMNPPEHKDSFSIDWCKEFLNYLYSTGIADIKTRFNPFNYNPEIFTGEKLPYEDSMKKRYFKMFTGTVRALMQKEVGLLPKIDLSDIKLTDFFSKKELSSIDQTPRDENSITKRELDYLFNVDLKDAELNRIKDIFLLQVGFGGLRVKEYSPDNLSIEDDGHGFKKVVFNTSHVQTHRIIHNPLNAYTEPIIKKYGGIPFYQDTKGNDIAIVEADYNQKLKAIAKAIGLKRKVKGKIRIDKKLVKGSYPIHELISSFWCRKTFSEMLEQNGVDRTRIKWFTGHSVDSAGGGKDILDNYTSKKFTDVVAKRKVLKDYKIQPDKITKL